MGLNDYIEIGRMDELGRMDTPVHRVDARVKIITTIVFIVIVMSFGRYDVSALVPLFMYPFAMIAVGRIPADYLFRKVAIAAPFALFVGMFNPMLDHQQVAMIGPCAVTGGWLSFISIMVRFVLTVSAALILVSCTGIYRLCAGMERLGMPKIFAVQLLFLYRYFFVIGDEGLRMKRSVEMRSVGESPVKLKIYGSLAGHLLLRSIDRAQRIYRAMVARGFDGEIRGVREARPGLCDIVFFAGWTAFFLCARLWNIADCLGNLLLRNI